MGVVLSPGWLCSFEHCNEGGGGGFNTGGSHGLALSSPVKVGG